MDKNTFSNKVNEVDVPKEDVLQSIKMGIARSVEEQRPKKSKKSMLKTLIMTTAAAVTLMSSSFIVPSFSRVLADAPVIGGLYETFNDMVGRNLEKQNLVKELNQTFTSNGVDVALTSAYYDGYLIGITFDVKGNLQEEKDGYYYALYELFNGDPLADETKELTTLTKTKDGYTGHIRIVYPYKDLPKNDTIPISFEEIGMNKGNWQFDVPVQQNSIEEYVFENKESTNPEGDVVFKVDSVITGKASTAIIYSVTYPKGGLDSFAMLNVYSNTKFPEEGMSDGKIDQLTNGDKTTVVRKLVIPGLLRNTTLKVEPVYSDTYSPVEPIIIDIP